MDDNKDKDNNGLELDQFGRCKKTGRFVKGFSVAGPGRPKGSRDRLTQQLLDRMTARQDAGLYIDEMILEIGSDSKISAETRLKALSKLADIVYNKQPIVEEVEDAADMSREELDAKLAQLLEGHKQ